MPGLYGVICRTQTDGLRDLADAMRTRMMHHPWYRTDEHCNESAGIAFGRVSLGFVQTAPQPVWSEDRQVGIVMEGELYGTNELRSGLAVSHRSHGEISSNAELLLAGYLKAGQSFFAKLNGTFIAAIWDGRTEQLLLINDRFGMKPLYYAHFGGKLLFASEIKSILADQEVPRGLHAKGISQFFSFGQNFCEDTFFKAIRTLPAASCLTYDRQRDSIRVDQYWSATQTTLPTIKTKQEYFDKIDAAFARAIRIRTADSAALGVSLSGGLDSRTILALVDQQTPVKCISMGMHGSLDHECAAKLSQLSGREHYRCMLDQHFLENFEQHMRHMVHLTDGHYLDQCIVIPTLPRYREVGIEVLLRGHAGELLHMNKAYNFSLDRDGWAIHDDASLRAWLRLHLSGYIMGGLPGPLFANITADDVQMHADESLDDALAESTGADPALNRVWQLFISQRLRRETAMSMAKIGTLMETRLPFMDNAVIETILAASPEWKNGEQTQLEILRRRCPQFLSVINANTGTWMGAGKLRRRISGLRMKVLGKLGVPGYQPYERLGLWLRRELKPMVREILLNERTLDRGVFNPNTIAKVVENHHTLRHNHTALLLAMLIFELGQREFVDGDQYAYRSESVLAVN